MTGDGEINKVPVSLSQLFFIIPTCIVVPATKKDIKVVLDQKRLRTPALGNVVIIFM